MYYILYMYIIYILYISYILIYRYIDICRYMIGRYIDTHSKYHDFFIRLLSKTLTDSYCGILKNENE